MALRMQLSRGALRCPGPDACWFRALPHLIIPSWCCSRYSPAPLKPLNVGLLLLLAGEAVRASSKQVFVGERLILAIAN